MIELISDYIGYIGIIVIGWGVILSIFKLFYFEFLRFKGNTVLNKVKVLRQELGLYLLLGLEILIAADVISTITEPTFSELGKLGGIVAIRTAINYFLEKEIQHMN